MRHAEVRLQVHERHLKRLSDQWTELPVGPQANRDHAYATDIDLLGYGSIFQRIDASRTLRGERTLVEWLCASAPPDEIRRRQEAVVELKNMVEFRQELEATGLGASGESKLDGAPFVSFTRKQSVIGPGIALVIHILPILSMSSFAAAIVGTLGWTIFAGLLAAQTAIALAWSGKAHGALELVSARRGYVEAFRNMLLCIEYAEFHSGLLKSTQQRLYVSSTPPSVYMARLDLWAGLSELRTQGPVHFIVNLLTLWDMHVLLRLEQWNRSIGQALDDVFDAVGEMEALSSLAGYAFCEPSSHMPDIVDSSDAFSAEALAHPLLPSSSRVANDVSLQGPGSMMIITGSNMAGKSTLLRAVGLNLAVGLAGGPVIARAAKLPHLALRTSIRVDDSLQKGASYFQAELTKIQRVVKGSDHEPVFFLLDELLRGTNARARHLGAKAILEHLLDRGATGLVATHDAELGALESRRPEHVRNAHFTDIMRDSEMHFDYVLRPGVVKGSNALALLRNAGIAVQDDASSPSTPEGAVQSEAS